MKTLIKDVKDGEVYFELMKFNDWVNKLEQSDITEVHKIKFITGLCAGLKQRYGLKSPIISHFINNSAKDDFTECNDFETVISLLSDHLINYVESLKL